ncbi:MAG: glycoside hydrolase family 25 protein [Actinomycetota bacterium]|nr:glycoside hydrolase family 25 protein [Actinomycetota bacterium]
MAAAKVPGIDVSEYQGRIDWRSVASTPTRFVIIRATMGNRYRDRWYAENLSGATANDLIVGAYHFAKPGFAPWDARAEADHFLDVARVAPGDLVPVLDIEETGGLSRRRLRVWTRTWLDRVRMRTGVRAMIYTGSHFWRGSMRNTSWFAELGHPLWVAHWYVRTPDVPGGRWAGAGYTVWQWSATGRIEGIKGDVDRNWVRRNLAQGTVASLTADPAEGGVISGDRIACGERHRRCSRLANPGEEIVLTAVPEPDARLIHWTGACSPAGDAPTCTVTALGTNAVSVAFGDRAEVAVTRSAVDPHLGALGCGTPCGDLPARRRSATSTGSGDGAPDPGSSAGVGGERSPHPWRRNAERRSIGGSYRWARRPSASISYAFRGGAVTLFTVRGRAMGKARISIDGATVATIDGYARRFRPEVRHRFTGLGGGSHVLTIVPLGRKRPAARDSLVVVDALRWRGRLHRDPKSKPVS